MDRLKTKQIIITLIAALLIAAPLGAFLTGCTSQKSKVDGYIADYADAEITIVGLLDEEFTITPGELAELELASSTATGQYAKAGTVNAIGPTLETFLAQYDKKPGDFKLVRFLASDGYRITLHTVSLEKYVITIAIANSDGPLAGSERPARLLIPGMESNQWIYAIERIEFEYLEE